MVFIFDSNQLVEVTITQKKIKEWFIHKGYDVNSSPEKLTVHVFDLQRNSNIIVVASCDFCNKKIMKTYKEYLDGMENNDNKKDCCKKCEPLKRVEKALSGYEISNINDIINYLISNSYKQIKAVYKIENLIDGSTYIGSTKRLFRRWNTHLEQLKKKTHTSKDMINAYHTYGKDVFRFSIVELIINDEDLIIKEQYYVDTYLNNNTFLYNHRVLDVSKNKGVEMSKENIFRMRERMMGKKLTNAHKEKIGKSSFGRIHSEETKDKMRKSKQGLVTLTSKLSEQDVLAIKKRLLKLESMQEIAKDYNVSGSTISNIKNGDIWSHVEIEEELELRSLVFPSARSGSSHSRSKLSDDDVREIRKRFEDGYNVKDIANSFKVEKSTIQRIKSGKTWTHVV